VVLFKRVHVEVSCQDLTDQSDFRDLLGWIVGKEKIASVVFSNHIANTFTLGPSLRRIKVLFVIRPCMGTRLCYYSCTCGSK
jgi:hypothetical protein